MLYVDEERGLQLVDVVSDGRLLVVFCLVLLNVAKRLVGLVNEPMAEGSIFSSLSNSECLRILCLPTMSEIRYPRMATSKCDFLLKSLKTQNQRELTVDHVFPPTVFFSAR